MSAGSPFIYTALDWSSKPTASASGFLAGAIVFIVVPLTSSICWRGLAARTHTPTHTHPRTHNPWDSDSCARSIERAAASEAARFRAARGLAERSGRSDVVFSLTASHCYVRRGRRRCLVHCRRTCLQRLPDYGPLPLVVGVPVSAAEKGGDGAEGAEAMECGLRCDGDFEGAEGGARGKVAPAVAAVHEGEECSTSDDAGAGKGTAGESAGQIMAPPPLTADMEVGEKCLLGDMRQYSRPARTNRASSHGGQATCSLL